MSPWLSYLLGVFTLPGIALAYMVGHDAVIATIRTRFRLGAEWDYGRSLPREQRPWLWKWPQKIVVFWFMNFLPGEPWGETTQVFYMDGSSYRRGKWGKAIKTKGPDSSDEQVNPVPYCGVHWSRS